MNNIYKQCPSHTYFGDNQLSFDPFFVDQSENYKKPKKRKFKKKELRRLLKLMEKEGYVFSGKKKKKGSRKKKHRKKASNSSTLNDLMILCLPKVIDICGECVLQKMKNPSK